MASSLLGRLGETVRRATQEIASLKKERERLLAEVELMREENRRARRLAREREELSAERLRLRSRLEKMLRRMGDLKL